MADDNDAVATLGDILNYDAGVAVTLQFTITDVGAGATPVDGVLTGGAESYVLNPGLQFRCGLISTTYNDARTAGDSTVKVTVGGVEIANGPEAVIDATNTLSHWGSANPDGAVIESSSATVPVLISVSATGDGSFAPVTADAYVVLTGYLVQK